MKTRAETIRAILPPLGAILFVMLGNGFFLSFTSLRLNDLGFDAWVVGLVHSAFYFGMFVGAARAETTITQVGHIRAYAAYAGLGISCLMLQGLCAHPIAWAFARSIMGFCLAVYYIVVESWFLCKATTKTRGVILALYMTTLYLSQATSQFALNIIDINSAQPFFLAALLSGLSIIPLTLTRAPSPQLEEVSGYSFRSLLKQSHFGFMGCFISGVILSSIYSFAPLFAETNELSVGLVMGVCIFGGVALQWPVGKLSDIFDRRIVLFGLTLITAAHSLLLVLIPPVSFWIYPLLFILGGFTFTLYPLAITQVCDKVQPKDLTRATGMLLLAYGLGSVIGPILAPLCIELSYTYGLFLFIFLNTLILIAIGIGSFRKSSAVPADMQGEFISLPPPATPVAYELDPRNDEE